MISKANLITDLDNLITKWKESKKDSERLARIVHDTGSRLMYQNNAIEAEKFIADLEQIKAKCMKETEASELEYETLGVAKFDNPK